MTYNFFHQFGSSSFDSWKNDEEFFLFFTPDPGEKKKLSETPNTIDNLDIKRNDLSVEKKR